MFRVGSCNRMSCDVLVPDIMLLFGNQACGFMFVPSMEIMKATTKTQSTMPKSEKRGYIEWFEFSNSKLK